ncbi:MAG: hypothetical protein ABL977_10995 [Candidatus Eisenbacteria bacterium]
MVELTNSAAIAAAPDGGLWFVCATTVYNEPDFTAGAIRLLRLTSAGALAPGWGPDGVTVDAFHGEALLASSHWAPSWNPFAGFAPASGLVAIAPGNSSGAFVAYSPAIEDAPGAGQLGPARLVHLDESGAPTAGWSGGPELLPSLGFGAYTDLGADGAIRAIPDGAGGVFAGGPEFYADGPSIINFQRHDVDAAPRSGGIRAGLQGLEFASGGPGQIVAGCFKPSGATSQWEADAFVSAALAGGGSYFESARSYYSTRYGDIGLSATGDGGAIFAWSQLIDRQGVFAVRLNPAGVVTGVSPSVGVASLRLRFVRGQGVLAVSSLAGAGRVTLSLHDLAGRTVSSAELDGAPGADVAFPGTRDLPGGVYFARASAGGKELHARVVVVR